MNADRYRPAILSEPARKGRWTGRLYAAAELLIVLLWTALILFATTWAPR